MGKFVELLQALLDRAVLVTASDASAANAILTKTFAAAAGKRNRLKHLSYYYSGANTAGTGTVETPSGTVVFNFPVPASATALQNVPLPADGIASGENAALIVKLPAGGAGITSTANTSTATS